MTSNYKSNGVDLDTILMKPSEDYAIPYEFRNYDSGYWGTTGELYGAGQYSLGEAASGNHRSAMTQISSGDWKSVSIGNRSTGNSIVYGVKRDGTLWWAASLYISPSNFGTDFSQVLAKETGGTNYTFLVLKKDGTLWAWGDNTYAQLGLGATSSTTSLTQVGTANDWAAIYGKEYSTFGVKKDGTLWAWGLNGNGQLGLGDLLNRSIPTKVGTLNNWKYVSSKTGSTGAIKTDGTLWTWGNNTYGQLGYVGNTSSPTQVGSLTDWKQVSIAPNTMIAVKTDGTMWGCGYANAAASQFFAGIISNDTKTSPVQIGQGKSWNYVHTVWTRSYAITTDGKMYVCGGNGYCALGINSPTTTATINNSNTQAFPLLDTWSFVDANSYNVIGIAEQG